jgi:hypothetical protein
MVDTSTSGKQTTVQKRVDPADVGLLYYTMAGGDFNKWKDYLTKIFGNH